MRLVDQLRLPNDRLPTEYPWKVAVHIYVGRIGVYVSYIALGVLLFITTIRVGMAISDGITLAIVFQLLTHGLVILIVALIIFLDSAADSLLLRSYSLIQDRSILLDRLLRVQRSIEFLRQKYTIDSSLPIESVELLGEPQSVEVKKVTAEIEDLNHQVQKWIQDNKNVAQDIDAYFDKYWILPTRFKIPQKIDVEGLESLMSKVKSMLPGEA